MSTLTKKVILLISPEPWDHIFVSKHHYANTLADLGNQVFFLNPPGKRWRASFVKHNLNVIDYTEPIPGIRFLPGFLQAFLFWFRIKLIEKRLRQKIDIIWNFDPSRFFQLALLTDTFRIAHLVDLNQVYSRESLCKTSDLVLCCTQVLLQQLQHYNHNAHFIHHGYNDNYEESEPIRGEDLKALYLGNLSYQYIDWQIIIQTIKLSKNVRFHFVGPLDVEGSNPPPKELYMFDNVIFEEPIQYSEIHSMLLTANILFLAYTENSREQMGNPHKMMEYLGSGKPIVSTYTAEYADLGLVEMVNHNLDFPNRFSKVVAEISRYDSVEQVEKRRTFAKANTYKKQIERISKLIRDKK